MADEQPRPLRILSLDGGGVKGITSLIILQAIFDKLSQEIGRVVRSYEYFDLIGGTSTGGLIAVLLGVLHCNVDEAIQIYNLQAPKIFKPKWWTQRLTSRYLGTKLKHYWFEGRNLERAVTEVLMWRGESPDMPLLQANDGKSKTFVCAVSAHSTHTELLRSYSTTRTDHTNYHCSAIEAVRATSAAPLFFEPIEISRLNSGSTATFIGGGLRVNNPIWELLSEAEHIWPGRDIGCLLSIGTGIAGFRTQQKQSARSIGEMYENRD